MASNKWSALCRTAARTRLPSCISNHLLRNFRSSINNLCTIVPAGTSTSDNLCTNSYNLLPQHQQQQQQQQRCTNNSSPVAAAELKAISWDLPCRFLPPVLMLPSSEVYEEEEDNNFYEGFFSLKNNRIMRLRKTNLPEFVIEADCVGSSKGWVAFVSRLDCRMYLADLFSPCKVVVFPSILSLPQFEGAITVLEKSVTQLSSLLIKRFALSSQFILNFIVMICLGDGHGLAFSRSGDSVWTPLTGSTQVEDIVYSSKDKLFYTILSKDGKFQAWDFNNAAADDNCFPKRIDFDLEIRYGDFHYPDFFYEQVQSNLYCIKYYLVESPEGEILFLARYSVSIGEDGSFVNADAFPDGVHLPIRTAFFAAFKLDFEKQIGVPVKSLGDTALFVGVSESFSHSTRDHPELMANSIYFADDKDDCIHVNSYPYGGDDIGVYNFENYSVTPLYNPFQFKKIRPPPIWFRPLP